jgi:hypothetical protein
MDNVRIIVNGIDVVTLESVIDKQAKSFSAMILGNVETIGLAPEDYKEVRKYVLDGVNHYKRSIVEFIMPETIIKERGDA